MAQRTNGREQLSRQDWLDAALRTVRSTGVSGLKVQELAASLGSTTGSLYWHFENRGELVRALVTHWGTRSTEEIANSIEASGDSPEMRLLSLMRLVFGNDATRSDLAIRAWATLDRRALRTVKAVDARRAEVVGGLFREMGFDEVEATMRTRVILCYESCERHVFATLSKAERERTLLARHRMLCTRP